ncbi:tyrosine-type recombinase/integrase [Streptomyces sasae]|uniref:tyrosine-type recombinase/integrase n=1 Tax=Streptomyces sasae TaxID=1266772 RepID=UPI00293083DB|nr:tyrosine-type recombinase/integrase [Streptomyces sasae]
MVGPRIVQLLINALAATGLTNADGESLTFSPHDFRRIFVTDAIMNGLPPHIAQVICGHRSIDTTIGYKAVYPAETIEAHRAFIARRRTTRPTRRVPNPDRGGVGRIPRPLRETEGVHRHLRTRLRNTLHP